MENALTPLYFDHEQSSFSHALGIPDSRKKEMRQEIEDMIKPQSKKLSAALEALLTIAKTDNERIYIAVGFGETKASTENPLHRLINRLSRTDVTE